MWSVMVKMRAGGKSEKPLTFEEQLDHPTRQLNSHHYLRKELYPHLRWDLRDGICIYSWQHVLARGSAHDDPAIFDVWAQPYMARRGDLDYLLERGRETGQKTGPLQIEEANVRLKVEFLKMTGKEFCIKMR